MNPDPEKESERLRPVSRGWRRYVRLIVAVFFLILGILGAFLPILPMTPFLLLASYQLVRSFPKLNERLLRSKLFGPVLTDWQVRGGVRTAVKYQAIVVVLIAVATTIYFSNFRVWVISIVGTLAAIGIIVIWKLPVARYPDLSSED